MNLLSYLLLMPQTQGAEGQQGNNWSFWLMMLLLIVVFYLFMIRPQSKRAKEERNFRESLQKGDRIVTNGGIHGKILEVDNTTVVIETEGQGRLRIEKSAIIRMPTT